MASHELCEPQVIKVLQKDGWAILRQQYPIHNRKSKRIVYADLYLHQVTEQGQQSIIVIEVKCFSRAKRHLDEFYHSIGQYLFYRPAMQLRNIPAGLYLAIPDAIYQTLLMDETIQTLLIGLKLQLMVVDLVQEEIVKWID